MSAISASGGTPSGFAALRDLRNLIASAGLVVIFTCTSISLVSDEMSV